MTLRGEIDMATAPWLADALRDACDRHKRVKVDLRDVSFIDSTGIRVLVRAVSDARDGTCEFLLVPGPDRVQRIFEITGTRDSLPFVSA